MQLLPPGARGGRARDGSAEPRTPLTLVACKVVRGAGGNNEDSVPIQATYRG